MSVQYSSLNLSAQKNNPFCGVCLKYFKKSDRVIDYMKGAPMMTFLHDVCFTRLNIACLSQQNSSSTSRFVALNRTFDTARDRIENFNRRKASGDLLENDPEVQELAREIDQLQKELHARSKTIHYAAGSAIGLAAIVCAYFFR